MPVYCYRHVDTNRLIEKFMSTKQMMRRQRRDGTIRLKDGSRARRSLIDEHRGFRDTPGNWPMKSDAAGVHPAQVVEAQEQARKMGIPTRFTRDGRAIFESPGHRKKYCEASGMYDRNGSYGDPQKRL